ncbi:MAG: PAAR domain-containing protein [Polyangiaceae bacterium]
MAVWEAAGVGHRITHEDDLPEPVFVATKAAQSIAQQMGKDGSQGSQGVHFAQGLAGHLQDLTVQGEGGTECPDPCGAIQLGSENTFIGPQKRMAATTNPDFAHDCSHHADGPVVEGAATTFVNRLPWGRRNDRLDCGARIGEGEPTIFVGGPPSQEAHQQTLTYVHKPALQSLQLGQQLSYVNPKLVQTLAQGLGMPDPMPQPKPAVIHKVSPAALGAAVSEGGHKFSEVRARLAQHL